MHNVNFATPISAIYQARHWTRIPSTNAACPYPYLDMPIPDPMTTSLINAIRMDREQDVKKDDELTMNLLDQQ